jgi:tRNA(Ile)-lysidine synthetase-like protein
VKRSRGASLEATARDARYRLLTSALQPGEVLLLAHHADDQLETVLLQLLRGSGLPGIAAMPAIAPFAGGFLARPLLSRSRAELEAWVRGQGLTWIEDDSNADEAVNRNYLRRRILPLIRERWPGSATAVARSARHAAEAQSLLDKLARADIERASYGESLSVKALRALPADRLNNALRFWITRAGARAPDTRRLEEIAGPLMTARDDANPFVEWGDGAARVQRHNDLLTLTVRADALSADTDPSLDDAQPTASLNAPFRADAQPAARANVPSAADAQPTARANVPSAADAQPTARANVPSAADAQPAARANVPSAADAQPAARANVPSAADAQPAARANVPSAADAQSAASANAPSALNHARSAGTNVPNALADSQSAGANELPTFAASLPTSARAHSAHSKSAPVEATAPLVWAWRDSSTCHLPRNLGKLELQPDAHGPIDLDALPHPLTIRWRRGGERLALRRGGPRRALKSLLQESHVPVSERSRLPLLVAVTKSGEKLLAVADLLVDETVQATSATRRRARLRWMKALR